jgi:hypothetical protein
MQVHLTNIRNRARELGGQIPCEPCRDEDDHQGCCREENKLQCDNFELFDDGLGGNK